MRDTTMDYDRWTAAPGGGDRSSRIGRTGSRVRLLLVIAAALLAFALVLEGKVAGRALGPASDRISAREDQHLEQVRYVLELDQARRAGLAAEVVDTVSSPAMLPAERPQTGAGSSPVHYMDGLLER